MLPRMVSLGPVSQGSGRQQRSSARWRSFLAALKSVGRDSAADELVNSRDFVLHGERLNRLLREVVVNLGGSCFQKDRLSPRVRRRWIDPLNRRSAVPFGSWLPVGPGSRKEPAFTTRTQSTHSRATCSSTVASEQGPPDPLSIRPKSPAHCRTARASTIGTFLSGRTPKWRSRTSGGQALRERLYGWFSGGLLTDPRSRRSGTRRRGSKELPF